MFLFIRAKRNERECLAHNFYFLFLISYFSECNERLNSNSATRKGWRKLEFTMQRRVKHLRYHLKCLLGAFD